MSQRVRCTPGMVDMGQFNVYLAICCAADNYHVQSARLLEATKSRRLFGGAGCMSHGDCVGGPAMMIRLLLR